MREGEKKIIFRKGFDPKIILSKIKKERFIESGKVVRRGDNLEIGFESVLVSALDFAPDVPWATRRELVRGVIFNPKLKEDFSESEFLRLLKYHLKSINLDKFKVIFRTNTRLKIPLGVLKIGNAHI